MWSTCFMFHAFVDTCYFYSNFVSETSENVEFRNCVIPLRFGLASTTLYINRRKESCRSLTDSRKEWINFSWLRLNDCNHHSQRTIYFSNKDPSFISRKGIHIRRFE